jgi:transcriptional regulator with XRE-family HTH domain
MSTPEPRAVVAYPVLVGQVIAHLREQRGIKQGDAAIAVGLSQSAYSRLEKGESVFSLSQLRTVAQFLGMQPSELLFTADSYEHMLRAQGATVVSEKKDYSAAVALGLGILAAALLR